MQADKAGKVENNLWIFTLVSLTFRLGEESKAAFPASRSLDTFSFCWKRILRACRNPTSCFMSTSTVQEHQKTQVKAVTLFPKYKREVSFKQHSCAAAGTGRRTRHKASFRRSQGDLHGKPRASLDEVSVLVIPRSFQQQQCFHRRVCWFVWIRLRACGEEGRGKETREGAWGEGCEEAFVGGCALRMKALDCPPGPLTTLASSHFLHVYVKH